MKIPVSVWIIVARTDVPYLLATIPHLIRACNYPFAEKVLAMDTVALTGDKLNRYGTGNQEQLDLACQTLLNQGVVDKIVPIDYEPAEVNRIYQKYFGSEQAQQMLNHTHNWKGSTVYGSLYCIEKSATDYYLHFDADMLLHQAQDYDWITDAIELMNSIPTIATIRPRCGSPHPEGKAFHPNPFVKDARGFDAHKFFSMRAYLIDRQRFSLLSPLPLIWHNSEPTNRKLESMELMVTKKLRDTDFVRADLSSTQAWTIHPPNHGSEFIQALPHLIELIEQGKYPPQQAGHYDLKLDLWEEVLSKN